MTEATEYSDVSMVVSRGICKSRTHRTMNTRGLPALEQHQEILEAGSPAGSRTCPLARCGVSKSKLVNAKAPCPAFGALKVKP